LFGTFHEMDEVKNKHYAESMEHFEKAKRGLGKSEEKEKKKKKLIISGTGNKGNEGIGMRKLFE
jgi:uncharacterized Zn finger protein